jgi:hypothetical protein
LVVDQVVWEAPRHVLAVREVAPAWAVAVVDGVAVDGEVDDL